ncbi:MAG: copper resistance D family protein, partial [Bosea sp. (in: a-proteobacteria)]|nr:copper resistance D family protein [Bosea sp. (in: a-proteobacteria)]
LPDAPTQTDPAVRALLWTTKVGIYLALFFGIGGAAFPAWVAPLPRSARRFSAILVVAGLAILPPAVTAQGLDALGAPFGDLLQGAIWHAGISSPFGRTVLIAAAALAVALISLAVRGGTGRVLALLALAGTGLALAASGHASAAEPQALMRSAVFVHAVSIAAWTGALFPLSVAVLGPNGAAALNRFSRRILTIVAAILLSGLVLAVVQVQRFEALTTTEYGRVLLIKMAWVLALFALAALNRYWLTNKVKANEASCVNILRRLILGEVALVLLVFGTAALWRFTPPPRALFMAAAQPAYVHIHTEKAMAEVTFTPGRVGSVAVSISLLNGDFDPLLAKELRIGLSNPGAGIEPIERQAVRADDGTTWRVKDLAIPTAGRWTVELEVLISDFEMLRLTETAEIKP